MRPAETIPARPAAEWARGRPLRRRFSGLVDGVGPADVVIALLFVAVLWLPPFVGHKAYLPSLAVLAAYAAYASVHERRVPPLPLVLVGYVVVYAVATLHRHTGALGLVTVKHGYFVRPLTAVAVATIAATPLRRLRALVVIVVIALSELLIAAVQAGRNVARYGRHATHTSSVDSVTGSLAWPGEPHQAAVLTCIGIMAALIVAAAWLWRGLPGAAAAVACAGLASLGALSSTRATPAFIAIAGAAMLAVAFTVPALGDSLRRLVRAAAGGIMIAALIPALTVAIYANVYAGAISKEQAPSLAPAHNVPRGASGRGAVSGRGTAACARVKRFQGTSLLPGRVAQVRLAVRLSLHDGAGVALLGRGPGASDIGTARYAYAGCIPPAKKTGSTWVGKLLTETGWLGLAAFVALLAWMILLGRELCRRSEPTHDRVVGLALTGVAALTAATAVYATFPAVSGYAVVFWVLLGLAIAAQRDVGPAAGVALTMRETEPFVRRPHDV